jgi:hypothetical protein
MPSRSSQEERIKRTSQPRERKTAASAKSIKTVFPSLHRAATLVIVALRHVWRLNTRMPDTGIDFSAPATLRKWPSINKQRVSASLGARPYMIGGGGTLDECIQRFMQLPEAQRHLYEIHTAQRSDENGILSADHIVELVRLRDFLDK